MKELSVVTAIFSILTGLCIRCMNLSKLRDGIYRFVHFTDYKSDIKNK